MTKYYSLNEVAKKTGLAITTVRNYVTEGRIKSIKFKTSRLVTEEQLKEFEENRNK